MRVGLLQLMPARIRVAVRIVRQDCRNVFAALTAERREPFSEGKTSSAATAGLTESRIEARTSPKIADYESHIRDANPAAALAEAGEDTSIERIVHFARSDVTLILEDDQTILEAGLASGVDLLFSCTMGGCGACMLDVLEGEVEYDEPEAICLTDGELADSTVCLACCGRPRGRVVVNA